MIDNDLGLELTDVFMSEVMSKISELKITRKDLLNQVKMKDSLFSRLVTANRKINVVDLVLLADALDIDLNMLKCFIPEDYKRNTRDLTAMAQVTAYLSNCTNEQLLQVLDYISS